MHREGMISPPSIEDFGARGIAVVATLGHGDGEKIMPAVQIVVTKG
jgi:hypothetical protein